MTPIDSEQKPAPDHPDPRSSGLDTRGLEGEDRVLALALRERLRASEALDYVTASRLGAARARALAVHSAPRRWFPGLWLGSGGVAAAALLVMVVAPWRGPLPVAPAAPALAQGDALEWLLDENDPEFYEDLELYHWLEEPGDSV